MPIQVLMPQFGESVFEGTITRWLKAVGDRVEAYEPLLEVNTDKVDTEVPSPAAGTLLEILVPAGTTARVGTPLALIGAPEEATGSVPQPAAASAPPPKPTQAEQHPPQPTPLTERPRRFISPVVARLAHEHQIDLAEVSGTGLGGRITKKDVLNYLEHRQAVTRPPSPPTEVAATTPPPAAPTPPAPAPAVPIPRLPGELLPLTPVRRQIAEHMVHSKHTSPHVTTVMEADLSRVIAHRTAHKEAYAKEGVNLTFTAYFAAAAVAALKAYPIVNSSWTDEGIRVHGVVNLGIATSLGEAGLIVPVIKNAEDLSLLGLARAINDLAQRARARQLRPEEVQGGTFSITNHGVSGSLFATPIIPQPQCAILGVGKVQKRVVVLSDPAGQDSLAIRPMVYLTLTFDHRILDGAIADGFLGKVVDVLQNWV